MNSGTITPLLALTDDNAHDEEVVPNRNDDGFLSYRRPFRFSRFRVGLLLHPGNSRFLPNDSKHFLYLRESTSLVLRQRNVGGQTNSKRPTNIGIEKRRSHLRGYQTDL